MTTEREEDIRRIPDAFRFIIQLYKEVAHVLKQTQDYLNGKGIIPLGGNKYVEYMPQSLNSDPALWLLRTPERYFGRPDRQDRLLGVSCVMFIDEEDFEPYVIAAVLKFKKRRDLVTKGKFKPSHWEGTLEKENLDRDFERPKVKKGIRTAHVKPGARDWKGWEGTVVKYFEVKFAKLESSTDVKEEICKPLADLFETA